MIEKKINNYSLFICKDNIELNIKISDFIYNLIDKSLKVKDRFQLCLCGGSTPKSLYKKLSKKELGWDKVDIFLGDERCVDPKSSESNTLMLKNSLLTNYGSKAFFYEIFSSEDIDDEISKQLLISKLNEKCIGNTPAFDLTLLGLGDDGHTASLFPYMPNNNEDNYIIFSSGKGLKRISLTPKIFSESKKIIFLVSGKSKQLALKRLLDKNESSDRTPAKLINSNSEILVFCDQEAANNISH